MSNTDHVDDSNVHTKPLPDRLQHYASVIQPALKDMMHWARITQGRDSTVWKQLHRAHQAAKRVRDESYSLEHYGNPYGGITDDVAEHVADRIANALNAKVPPPPQHYSQRPHRQHHYWPVYDHTRDNVQDAVLREKTKLVDVVAAALVAYHDHPPH